MRIMITGGAGYIGTELVYRLSSEPGIKEILIYSDLKEDLPKGFVRDIPLQLQGFNVVALNVTKLRSDNRDPREYLTRLENWQNRVEEGGGQWVVINDMDRLERILVN